jgi:ATP phosphoribosyltransferase
MTAGTAHLGVTGEDLVREQMADADASVTFVKPLGFGFADVVVAVPNSWLDVATMSDLDTISASFLHAHGRRLRVATKYLNITRRFFARHGVTDYRIVESLGATEGTPAAGTADLIVDITTTGETLRANGLRILDDGVILKSEANLVAAKGAAWSEPAKAARDAIFKRLGL